jgi:thiol-disulfide isomerase/thioredoxin
LKYDYKGRPFPETDFLNLNGRGISLTRFKGRPVLLNLWATWCGPCVLEMPTLDRLAQQQAGRLEVVVVSQDLKGAAQVNPWWAAHKFRLLQPYTDPEDHMLAGLNGGDVGAGSLPTTVLFDKEGREVWRMLGAMDWTSPRAAELLAEGMK